MVVHLQLYEAVDYEHDLVANLTSSQYDRAFVIQLLFHVVLDLHEELVFLNREKVHLLQDL